MCPSAVQSKAAGKKTLYGNFAKWEKSIQEPSVGTAVEVALGYGLDTLAATSLGSGLDGAFGDAAGGSSVPDVPDVYDPTAGGAPEVSSVEVSSVADAGGGDAPDVSGAADVSEGDITGDDTGGADVGAKAGEDSKLFGDEIKSARAVKAILVKRFGGGGAGGNPFEGLGDEIGEAMPDDLKVSRPLLLWFSSSCRLHFVCIACTPRHGALSDDRFRICVGRAAAIRVCGRHVR